MRLSHAATTSRPRVRVGLVILSSLPVSAIGCAALVASLTPPPPQPISLNYRMPAITPVQAGSQALAKGGVTITATPVTYVEAASSRTDEAEVSRGFSCRRLREGIEVTPVRVVRTTTTPTFGVAPDRLAFLVKVNNQMARVLRGAGVIVQFNVAGQLVSVPQTQYAELANLILTPRSEADLRIVGPPLSSLPEGSTIGLFLYDVVTKTDAAGNVTEKQNFEWYYTYRSSVVSRQGVVQTGTREDPIGSPRMSTKCT